MAWYIISAIFLVACDRLFKIIALHGRNPGFNIVNGWLRYDFTGNYNIAFSLPLSGILLDIAIIIIIFILVYVWLMQVRRKNFVIAGLLTYVIFGAISNVIDRLQYGFVIDYLDVKFFTVFNLADAMITVGIILLVYIVSFKDKTKT